MTQLVFLVSLALAFLYGYGSFDMVKLWKNASDEILTLPSDSSKLMSDDTDCCCTATCPTLDTATTYYLTVTDAHGCTCLSGLSITLTYNSTCVAWVGSTVASCGTIWGAVIESGGNCFQVTLTTNDPFSIPGNCALPSPADATTYSSGPINITATLDSTVIGGGGDVSAACGSSWLIDVEVTE